MASYFFCSGIAEVSEFAIQCSEVFQTYQPPTEEAIQLTFIIETAVYYGLFYGAIFFIFSQIKKAIEAN